MLIRPSRDEDLPAIQAIYAHYVAETLCTLDLAVPGVDEMAGRRNAVRARALPWLVAEEDGTVAGYAYAGPYRLRAGFDNTVEDALYIAPDRAGRGVGRALLGALIAECERLGYRQMVAVIGNAGNAPSIRLHEVFGFRHVGLLPAIGWKGGRWLDCVLMQRALGVGDSAPPGAG